MATESYYNGSFDDDQMCLTIIARKGSSSGASVGSDGSPGGHTYLAFEWSQEGRHRHVVYHLVGSRNSSACGSGYVVANLNSSPEKLVPKEGQAYESVGAKKGGSSLTLKEKLSKASPDNDSPANWWGGGALATKSINVGEEVGKAARKKFSRHAKGKEQVGVFSLVGASLGMGTNCVSFALDILKEAGVEPDRTMYLLSFVSPYMAVSSGSLQLKAAAS